MKIRKKDIIYAGIVILLLFLLKCSHDSKKAIKNELVLRDSNIKAMQDSVSTFKLKNGEMASEKLSMVTKLKNLKLYNESLYNRINGLSKQLDSRPIVYVNVGAKIVHDTVEVEKNVSKISSDEFLIDFKKDTIYSPGNEKHISGKLKIFLLDSNDIKVTDFTIDKDEMVFSAEIVFSEKNKEIVTSVISDHPGFNAESIQPVTLDPKLHPALKKLNNKRFILGPQVGIGISYDGKIIPQVGVGLTYKIIGFK